ncbi:MAG: metallophosphoesterase [Verrucomicrobiae bacterium]|nr:metallophosphoesterase [Verrucomicrobiae bacterium]MCP5550617.1 metallophosphoesterase [Akkermansiaceae bacterium]
MTVTAVAIHPRPASSSAAAGDRPGTWPEFSFLVVSDTHLGRNDTVAAEKQWEKTAAELARAEGDFILHLGDVVDGRREAQYPHYRRIRDTIGKPVFEIPGNHDPETAFETHLGLASADRSFAHGGVRFVLFNNSRPDSHEGFVTADQLAWLETECGAAAEKDEWLVFAAHVPFHTNKPPDRAWYVKPENGQTAFYELVERHRARCLAMFHGHFHNGVRGWDDRAPLHEVLFPSALYNQDRGLAAKKAPGYNLPEFRPAHTSATFAGGSLTLTVRPTGETGVEGTEKRLPYSAG